MKKITWDEYKRLFDVASFIMGVALTALSNQLLLYLSPMNGISKVIFYISSIPFGVIILWIFIRIRKWIQNKKK